jgi:hypothetical protein
MAELEARGQSYNKRDSREKLLNQLRKDGSSQSNKVEQVAKVKFLKHPVNGRVYTATPELLRLGTMIPVEG